MKKIILILCFCYTNVVFGCNTTIMQDGVVLVGSGPKPNGMQPEVSTIQEAVDIVQNCEFLISQFTVQSGVTVDVLNGSNVISNNNVSTSPWVGGAQEIKPSDLIRIDNSGNWYEVESVTADTIITTRPIDMVSGAYEYSTSITPSIQLFTRVSGIGQPIYIETADLKDIHFLEIRPESDSMFATWTSNSDVKITSPNAPSYGHLRLERLEITGRSTGGMYLGYPFDGAGHIDNPHDIDLTLEAVHIVSTRGVDGIKSNYHGDIKISNSEFYSLNDVVFLPYKNSYLPPRSILIDNSSFVTGTGITQTHKILTMEGRNNGVYQVTNSLISSTTSFPKQEGKALQFSSIDFATLEITDSRITCTGCNNLSAAIVADGTGTSIVIDNIEVSVSPNDCAFLTRNNSSITVTNSSIARNEAGDIVTCGDGTGSVSFN